MMTLDEIDAIFASGAPSASDDGSLVEERARRVEELTKLRDRLVDGSVEDEAAVAEKIGVACRDRKFMGYLS